MFGFRSTAEKEEAILDYLYQEREERTGQQIRVACDLGRGTVYVYLSNLQDRGYIESRQLTDVAPPLIGRRVYRLTEAGRKYRLRGKAKWFSFSWIPQRA
jgi:DNA-binding PadR family transcriptional regulator